MSKTPRTDAMQVFLWQHDETGRTCWAKTSPGPRWNRVGVPALCLLDDARQLERELTAERERADRAQEDAERYQWLRMNRLWLKANLPMIHAGEFDAAIDAALRK